MTREAERRPRQDGGVQDITRGDGDKAMVADPVSLATALAGLLELSGERDTWMARLGDEYRLGWKVGYAAGVDEGRRQVDAEHDAAWNRIASPVIRGITHAELLLRRWGPGGRGRFGEPRPGDFTGRRGAA